KSRVFPDDSFQQTRLRQVLCNRSRIGIEIEEEADLRCLLLRGAYRNQAIMMRMPSHGDARAMIAVLFDGLEARNGARLHESQKRGPVEGRPIIEHLLNTCRRRAHNESMPQRAAS